MTCNGSLWWLRQNKNTVTAHLRVLKSVLILQRSLFNFRPLWPKVQRSQYISIKFLLTKAELLQVSTFFLIQFFAWEILLIKKLEIEETKTTYYSTFKTDIIKVGLLFSISYILINKIHQANNWSTKKINSSTNSALVSNFVWRFCHILGPAQNI